MTPPKRNGAGRLAARVAPLESHAALDELRPPSESPWGSGWGPSPSPAGGLGSGLRPRGEDSPAVCQPLTCQRWQKSSDDPTPRRAGRPARSGGQRRGSARLGGHRPDALRRPDEGFRHFKALSFVKTRRPAGGGVRRFRLVRSADAAAPLLPAKTGFRAAVRAERVLLAFGDELGEHLELLQASCVLRVLALLLGSCVGGQLPEGLEDELLWALDPAQPLGVQGRWGQPLSRSAPVAASVTSGGHSGACR
jgi:hypothetical protein